MKIKKIYETLLQVEQTLDALSVAEGNKTREMPSEQKEILLDSLRNMLKKARESIEIRPE